jgi:hypothetical protein
MQTGKKRKWSHWILAVLVVWQAIPMFSSRIYSRIRNSESDPIATETDRQRFESFVHPSDADANQSKEVFENIILSHMSAMTVWKESVGKLLSGANAEAVLSEASKRLPQSPQVLAGRYESSASSLKQGFSRAEREDVLRTALDYGYRDERLFKEITEFLATAKYQSPYTVYPYIFALVEERKFDEAIDVASNYWQRENSQREYGQLLSDLKHLRENPNDFDSNLVIARSPIGAFAGNETLLEFCYKLWPTAKTPEAQASLLLSCLPAFSKNGNEDLSLFFASNAVKLTSAAAQSHSSTWADLMAVIADQEAQHGNNYFARDVFGFLAQNFPPGRNWGVHQYNYAILLKKTGFPRHAEPEAIRLIDSNVNDQDEGPNLMDTYRNYRHEAALLISDVRSSVGDFEGSLRWQYLAATKYKYTSWCGTCADAEAMRTTEDLFTRSLKAGPIYVVRYFTVYPYMLLLFSPVAPIALIVVIRRRLRRRRRLMRLKEERDWPNE